jgi:hypothetical protein
MIRLMWSQPSPIPITQWVIAVGSLGSALIALALGLGLKEWISRPRIRLILRNPRLPEEVTDRVITRRIDSGETAAFVRLRVDNRGRSTARNVALRLLQTHTWDARAGRWLRVRPELDGWLLQPSNQFANELHTMDIYPYTDRVVDLVSVATPVPDQADLHIEITHPWPPHRANVLSPGVWQLQLLVCGDNIVARQYFVMISFDGHVSRLDDPTFWEHITVTGPSTKPIPLSER